MRGKPSVSSHGTSTIRITPACAGKTACKSVPDAYNQDHPRVCGENTIKSLISPKKSGSPPRVRGKRSEDHRPSETLGITPACAGKTFLLVCRQPEEQDHPRVCGENRDPDNISAAKKGSPPRVRGKLLRLQHIRQRRRITPACAGKTCILAHDNLVGEDHPRVCGENIGVGMLVILHVGSPPRVRGKRDPPPQAAPGKGITPACAGKTCSCFCSCSCSWDHPRVCGENMQWSGEMTGAGGSPPRVRGKPHVECMGNSAGRITPACAGKTKGNPWAKGNIKDHPRVCGENKSAKSTKLPISGSPPRVRGKLQRAPVLNLFHRITPACAGKTADSIGHTYTAEDHPRVCGENGRQNSSRPCLPGSPPRVRGKHARYRAPNRPCRITPACAGKTAGRAVTDSEGEDHPRVCGENICPSDIAPVSSKSPPRVRGKHSHEAEIIEAKRITPACAGKTQDNRNIFTR